MISPLNLDISHRYSRYIILAASLVLTGYTEITPSSRDIVFYLEDEPIYTSSNSLSPGFLMEVVMEMTKHMGISPKIKFLPWKRAQYLTINQANAVIFPLTRSSSRESNYQWLCKIFEVPVMFISESGNPVLHTIEQARRVRGIGVIRGTPQEEYLKMMNVPYIALPGNELYAWLAKDKVTAIYTAKPEAILGWKKGGFQGKLQFGAKLQTLPLWVATSLQSGQVSAAEWLAALTEVKESGFFDKMLVKYFGEVD